MSQHFLHRYLLVMRAECDLVICGEPYTALVMWLDTGLECLDVLQTSPLNNSAAVCLLTAVCLLSTETHLLVTSQIFLELKFILGI